MALITVKSIEEALTLVDEKKQRLKKAFEELESHASLLSSLSFSWTDLDSYFSSAQSELLDKLSALQALEASQTRKPKPGKRKDPLPSEPVPARPQLKSLCEKMDALGLRQYLIDHPKDKNSIRAELADAFKHAPDAGLMVLDALEGFWDGNLESGSRLRTACVELLEELMRDGVQIGPEARERAKAVAAEWKAKTAEPNSGVGGEGEEEGKDEDLSLERLGYLQLLASYKLLTDGGYDGNELVDYVVLSPRYGQTVYLCRVLGLQSIIPDVVRRLIAYVMDSMQSAQKVRKSGKSSRRSLNEAATKEIGALKTVIKYIDDHGLESQYPKDEILTRIEKLKRERADRKRTSIAPVHKFQLPPKIPQHNGSKRLRTATGPSAFNRKLNGNSVVRPSLPSSTKMAGRFPAHKAPYLSSPSGAYGTAGSLVAAAPYVGPTADMYGFPGAPLGLSGNLNPSNSYTSEIHAQPVYHNSALGYGGYDVPSQYPPPPVYYPQ